MIEKARHIGSTPGIAVIPLTCHSRLRDGLRRRPDPAHDEDLERRLGAAATRLDELEVYATEAWGRRVAAPRFGTRSQRSLRRPPTPRRRDLVRAALTRPPGVSPRTAEITYPGSAGSRLPERRASAFVRAWLSRCSGSLPSRSGAVLPSAWPAGELSRLGSTPERSQEAGTAPPASGHSWPPAPATPVQRPGTR
jgi:hypothetical protein